MKKICLILSLATLVSCSAHFPEYEIGVDGLEEPVEILRDRWGINHIYARNQHDLFFAQGYLSARDRLFQFEIWRRQATGTIAEILGKRELTRDIGARLFRFRGDIYQEMDHYHPDGKEIITAFTAGINAYINEIMKTPESLPLEFKLLGIQPEEWTPEVVVSRHQGLLLNVRRELEIGRAVSRLGVDKVKELEWFHPKDPVLDIDPSIKEEILFNDILELYNTFRQPLRFQAEDVLPEYRNADDSDAICLGSDPSNLNSDGVCVGSNNWILNGNMTEDGNAYMANDPHRSITVPSLRYMAHLIAPGWNVIGGSEPEIPGISIGHNEYGSWGLTVFRTDCEDLYVYELNPENLHQYKYRDSWENMKILKDIVRVKDDDPIVVDLRFTRHGPVCYVDSNSCTAVAIRCGWLEIGGSPYLASLRIDQSETWEEFRSACAYFHIPGENMVWADKMNNIGWQAVGIAPLRRNFSGLVPVPGDGRYEWDGYLPISRKPGLFNPDQDYFATANQNITPDDYSEWDAIGYTWYDPFRGMRVSEVLESGKKMNMNDMMALQTDYHSIPARILVPLLLKTGIDESGMEKEALNRLKSWDYRLDPESVPAAIYNAWETQLRKNAVEHFVPSAGKDFISSIYLKKIIDWLLDPEESFGADAQEKRNEFIRTAFIQAVATLQEKLGSEMERWQYGQKKYKHVFIQHPLSKAVNSDIRSKLNLGCFPRGGNAYTVGASGIDDRQSHGATFRMIVNTGEWDQSLGTNSPGQSGDPDSPFYSNLYELWAKDKYFPVYYSREEVEKNAVEMRIIRPLKK